MGEYANLIIEEQMRGGNVDFLDDDRPPMQGEDRIGQLHHEAARHGLAVRKCSQHHYQICDESGPLVDVWPTTNRFRWHGAKENIKARSGGALRAVKEALHCQKVNESKAAGLTPPAKLPPALKAELSGLTILEAKALRHLLTLAAERLLYAGGTFDVALAQEIQSHLS